MNETIVKIIIHNTDAADVSISLPLASFLLTLSLLNLCNITAFQLLLVNRAGRELFGLHLWFYCVLLVIDIQVLFSQCTTDVASVQKMSIVIGVTMLVLFQKTLEASGNVVVVLLFVAQFVIVFNPSFCSKII
jgi:hypothetical protein